MGMGYSGVTKGAPGRKGWEPQAYRYYNQTLISI